MRITPKYFFVLVSILGLPACDSDPQEVYVPVTEPEVEIVVSASATEVSVGEPVVLFAVRRNLGMWKQIKRKELAREQCWLRRPPPEYEKEVSDNLRWEALPSKGAHFNTNIRSDHTREVLFVEPGMFILESRSRIPCHPGKDAKGKPIKIWVKNGNASAISRLDGSTLLQADVGVIVPLIAEAKRYQTISSDLR